MGATLVSVLLTLVANLPTASRTGDGQTVRFAAAAAAMAEGVKVTVAVLESCSYSDFESYTAADLEKARLGDHFRLTFPKPVAVTLSNRKLEVSEVVYAAGVFWLRCGDKVGRCAKYRHEKWLPFEAWFRRTQ